MARPRSAAAVPPPATGLPPEARAAVLTWFDERGRELAFRATRDPYAILVSEVMAQQTQVSRVVEAWARFLARFPTVADLAVASPADVLRAWQGMGYDRRALNLRRAAQAIVDDHRGLVPRDLDALMRLPGIGPYTARAVAAIAFGTPVGAVDTNVRRVLGRAVGGARAEVVARPGWIQAVADGSVDPGRPGDWTHALMDIGATICRPRTPDCAACPLREWCHFAGERSAAAPLGRRDARNPASPARPRALPFPSTTRWLRGRIVDRLRGVDGSAWARLDGPIGEHDRAAVRSALGALAREGVVERDPIDPDRARLALD
jgi:A/G-specific adenine glycosylase